MCTTSCPAKCVFCWKKLIGRVKVWKEVGAHNDGMVKFKGGNGKVGIVATGGGLQRNMLIVVIIRCAGFNNQEETSEVMNTFKVEKSL